MPWSMKMTIGSFAEADNMEEMFKSLDIFRFMVDWFYSFKLNWKS